MCYYYFQKHAKDITNKTKKKTRNAPEPSHFVLKNTLTEYPASVNQRNVFFKATSGPSWKPFSPQAENQHQGNRWGRSFFREVEKLTRGSTLQEALLPSACSLCSAKADADL